MIKYYDDIVGKEFDGKYGRFIVVCSTDRFSGSARLYKCKFIEDGYEGLYRKEHILNGNIKNPYYPSICGVACIGRVNSDHFLYGTWRLMINRCYNKNANDFKYYGGNGIVVCKEWLCFEHYIKDVVRIDGFDEDLKKKKMIELDKDISKGKIYDKHNTKWISSDENKKIANAVQIDNLKTFVAIRIFDGYTERCKSKNEFAKKHNLHHECICRCLLGKQKRHKGWEFRYE